MIYYIECIVRSWFFGVFFYFNCEILITLCYVVWLFDFLSQVVLFTEGSVYVQYFLFLYLFRFNYFEGFV